MKINLRIAKRIIILYKYSSSFTWSKTCKYISSNINCFWSNCLKENCPTLPLHKSIMAKNISINYNGWKSWMRSQKILWNLKSNWYIWKMLIINAIRKLLLKKFGVVKDWGIYSYGSIKIMNIISGDFCKFGLINS